MDVRFAVPEGEFRGMRRVALKVEDRCQLSRGETNDDHVLLTTRSLGTRWAVAVRQLTPEVRVPGGPGTLECVDEPLAAEGDRIFV